MLSMAPRQIGHAFVEERMVAAHAWHRLQCLQGRVTTDRRASWQATQLKSVGTGSAARSASSVDVPGITAKLRTQDTTSRESQHTKRQTD